MTVFEDNNFRNKEPRAAARGIVAKKNWIPAFAGMTGRGNKMNEAAIRLYFSETAKTAAAH